MDDALATTMPSLEACNIHTGTLLATTSKDHAGMVLAGEAGDEKRHEKTPFVSEGGWKMRTHPTKNTQEKAP